MTIIEQVECLRLAVREELGRSRHMLESVGLTWSGPTLTVSRHCGSYTAELKVEFLIGDDLVDIFEFFVCECGVLTTSEEEVRQWIQNNVPDVVKRREKKALNADGPAI